MGQLVELVLAGLIGWVPERPRRAMWLAIAVYVGVVAGAVVIAVDALVG